MGKRKKQNKLIGLFVIITFILWQVIPFQAAFADTTTPNVNNEALPPSVVNANNGDSADSASAISNLGHYCAVVFGNQTSNVGDSEGAFAIQGNLSIDPSGASYTIGTAVKPGGVVVGDKYTGGGPILLLGGNLKVAKGKKFQVNSTPVVTSNDSKISTIYKGNEFVGNKIEINRTSSSEIASAFAAMKNKLNSFSKFAKSTANVMDKQGYNPTKGAWSQNPLGLEPVKGTNIVATGDLMNNPNYAQKNNTLEIGGLNIPAIVGNSNTKMVIIYSSAKIVNFSSAGESYNGNLITYGTPLSVRQMLGKKIVWCFPNATQVNLNGKQNYGAIIAPNATVVGNGGGFNGQVSAKNFIQAGRGNEVHNFYFDWNELAALAKGSLKIIKENEGGDKLAGAVFNVFDANKNIVAKVSTNSNGVAEINNLPVGEYSVQEIVAPKGYELNNKVQTVEVTAGNIQNLKPLTFKDKKIQEGAIKVLKEGNKGNKLANAKFGVYSQDGKQVDTIITNANGEGVAKNLKFGTYTVKEISAPNGYKLDSKSQQVTVNTDDIQTVKPLKFIDARKQGNLEVIKNGLNQDGKLVNLSGAEFKVQGPHGNILVNGKNPITNKDGSFTLSNLEWGTYTITEVEAPKGYELDSTPKTITINENNVDSIQILRFSDSQKKGSLEVVKKGLEANGKTVNLSGAEFKVQGPQGNVLVNGKNPVTDKDGSFTLSNLQWGTYTVTEVKAPNGYALDSTPQSVIIDGSNSSKLQVMSFSDTQIKGSITIEKVNKSGTKLAGAEFKVTGPNGYSNKVTTDSNGSYTLTNLEWGKYTIQEVQAPAGYKLDSKTQEFTIDGTHLKTLKPLIFTDTQEVGSFIIKKTNKNGDVLEGAEFKITGPNGYSNKVTTNKKGTATVSNLEWGTYTIKEIQAPIGYELDTNIQTVKINSTNVKTVETKTFVDKKIYGVVSLIKTGFKDKQLAGATYAIYTAEAIDGLPANAIVGSLVTSANGAVTSKELPYGKYYLQEIKAPQGYSISKIQYPVNIDKEGQVVEIHATDTVIKGSLTIIKEDATTLKTLQGAQFTITCPDGSKIIKTTDANGEINLTDLNWGTYTVQETGAPVGYELNKEAQTVKIDSEHVQKVNSLTFKDNETKGSITIEKVSKSGTKLAGAEFKVTGPNGYSNKITTDSNGSYTLTDLAWGKYTIQEVQAPVGYKLDSKIQEFTIDATHLKTLKPLIFTDTKELGKLEVIKTSKDGKALQGAVFNVSGKDFNKTVTTGENGIGVLNNIPWGTYTIKEVQAPIGYNIDKTLQYVTVNGENAGKIQTKKFVDTKIYGQVSLIKTGVNKTQLAGAEYGIYTAEAVNGTSANALVGSLTTVAKGTVISKELPYGKYYLQEIKAPKGYSISKTQYPVNIDKEGQVVEIHAIDTVVKGSLTIIKEDATTLKTLQGAQFTITCPDGSKIIKTTDANGEINLTDLNWGTYTVQETGAPVGYELNKEAQTVKIDSEHVQKVNSLTFKDNETKGSITIEKVSKSGTKLAGAEFKVTGPNGYSNKVTTDSNGSYTLTNLAWGKYTIQEVQAPAGYKLDSKIQEFTIDATHLKTLKPLTFTDTKEVGSFIIKKTNKNGDVLEGAEFKITGPNGYSNKVTTNKKGIATVSNLEWGTYTIKEIQAPIGYELDTNIQTVKINSTNVKTVETKTFVDKKIYGVVSLIKTGFKDKQVAGATYAIYTAEAIDGLPANAIVGSLVTSANGAVTSKELPYGKYYLQETKAPTGYNISTTQYPVVISKDGQVIKINAKDSIIKGKFEIIKESTDGIRLQGAEFTVTYPDGTTKIVTTGNNGTFILNNLEWGTYEVRESKAPVGYAIDNTVQSITINASNYESAKPLIFKDSKLVGKVILQKISESTSKPLQGAVFTLKDGNGKVLGKYTTNEEGIIEINNLPFGEYSLTETIAPQGYNKLKSPIEFSINSNDYATPIKLVAKDTKIKETDKIVEHSDHHSNSHNNHKEKHHEGGITIPATGRTGYEAIWGILMLVAGVFVLRKANRTK